MRLRRRCRGLLSFFAALILLLAHGIVAQAQGSQMSEERIAELRTQIHDAEARHAAPVELGKLWLALANRYQDELQFVPAEDGFARAIRMLKGSGHEEAYAEALDGMGSLYVSTNRLDDALAYIGKARMEYEALGNGTGVAHLHVLTAVVKVVQRKYRDAGSEAQAGIDGLDPGTTARAQELASAYLVHGIVLCQLGQPAAALAEVDRAKAIVDAKLKPGSMEETGVWMVRGLALSRSGSEQEAEQAMQEALRCARSMSRLPRELQVDAQIQVLKQMEGMLKSAHKKPEAKQVEAELEQLQGQRVQGCMNCTVSAQAAALGPSFGLR